MFPSGMPASWSVTKFESQFKVKSNSRCMIPESPKHRPSARLPTQQLFMQQPLSAFLDKVLHMVLRIK